MSHALCDVMLILNCCLGGGSYCRPDELSRFVQEMEDKLEDISEVKVRNARRVEGRLEVL